jgi:neutral ceramidase
VVTDAAATIRIGSAVGASFRSGHPRHHLQTMATYLSVQRLVSGTWQTVATDDDPTTRIRWRRADGFMVAEVEWQGQDPTPPGVYRLLHHGHFKDATGIHPYLGISQSFDLIQ